MQAHHAYLKIAVILGKQRAAAIPVLGPKLAALSASLVSSLLHALADSTLRKAGVVALTLYLIQLGQANAARDAFLQARGELVRKRARMIAFEGEIAHYVTELAIVIFTCIKHTAEWYLASFKENDMASGASAPTSSITVNHTSIAFNDN
jgi:hypothetical protein